MASNGCTRSVYAQTRLYSQNSVKVTSQATWLTEAACQLVLAKSAAVIPHYDYSARLSAFLTKFSQSETENGKWFPFNSSRCERKCSRSMGVEITQRQHAYYTRVSPQLTPLYTWPLSHNIRLYPTQRRIAIPFLILTCHFYRVLPTFRYFSFFLCSLSEGRRLPKV